MISKKIKAKGVWYKNGITYDTKIERGIYFGSQAEYKCWLTLQELFPEPDFSIYPHLSIDIIGGIRWKVDFTVKCNTDNKLLSKIKTKLNNTYDREIYTPLYIEYKDVPDKLFLTKLEHILKYEPYTLAKDLIILGTSPEGYIFEDLTNLETYVKLKYSVQFFRRITHACQIV